MASIVDHKLKSFQSRYGRDLGLFLLEKIAVYEADFREENKRVVSFSVFEGHRDTNSAMILALVEENKPLTVFETQVRYKTKNLFTVLLVLELI